jgi:hypothetical protein
MGHEINGRVVAPPHLRARLALVLRGQGVRRPSRREETEALKDYIAELKEELQDAEERLKDLEK